MTSNSQRGTRARFVSPAAPAPVPDKHSSRTSRSDDGPVLAAPRGLGAPTSDAPKAASATALKERDVSRETSPSHDDERAQKASDQDVVRSTGSMAIATLVSRLTGFLRTVLITATLGGAIASAFNTANTLPNLITEIVLGAVLTSLVVPVLVRAEKEDPDRGEAFIRRLFTLAATLLGTITLISVLAAPWLTRTMLDADGEVNVIQSTSFAYLLLPQIFFYGLFSLLMAVLNTKGVFKPGAWAPVANNVISIVVLLAYYLVPGSLSPSDPTGISDPHILLLGAGTTLGVIVQALIMVPPIRKAGISLKPLWGIDARLKQFGGMAIAIVVYVAISQLGYIITTRIASAADAEAPAIYQQAWLLLQVPYGIIGVTLLTAIMPRLSRNAADGDEKAVVGDLVMGSKLTFLALIPIVVYFTAFGVPIAQGLFAWGNFSEDSAAILGFTLSFSSFTLLPYALVLLHLRVFYAREEAWLPTFIIGGITITKVVLSFIAPMVASSPERVVVLLGFANGFGFVAGAIIGAVLLRRKLGNLGSRDVARTCLWAFAASAVGVAVAMALSWLMRATIIDALTSLGSLRHVIHIAITGIVFLIVTGLVLSRSNLDEVRGLGRALQRIPGLNKIIKVAPAAPQTDTETDSAEGTQAATHPLASAQRVPVEFSAESMAFDATFNATPTPPPMSAGIVRGPRLIPGAEVADGRFRLLKHHGSADGAQFWQAREKDTGREVALTFIDTTTNTTTDAEARHAAERIATTTHTLAALQQGPNATPAVAGNIDINPYPTGALIIADWTPGRPLSHMANTNPDPYAATLAFQPLAETAHKRLLGLDNHSRIRISTNGIATLAFPGILPGANHTQDLNAIHAGIRGLIDPTNTPQPIADLLADDPDNLPANLTQLHHTIYNTPQTETPEAVDTTADDAANTSGAEAGAAAGVDAGAADVDKATPTTKLVVTEETTPKPQATPGFGAQGYSRGAGVVLGLAAITLVLIAAIITAWLTSLFSSDDTTAPVNPGAIIATETSETPNVNLIRPIAHISAWAQDMSKVDNQSQTATNRAIDGNPTTGWAVRPGQGLIMHTKVPGTITQLNVRTENAQKIDVRIYGIPEDRLADDGTNTITNLDELTYLTEETLDKTTNTITFAEPEHYAGLLMMMESTTGTDAIQELTVVGF